MKIGNIAKFKSRLLAIFIFTFDGMTNPSECYPRGAKYISFGMFDKNIK